MLSSKSRAARFAALVAGAGLVLAACGGGGEDDGTTGQMFAECEQNPNECNSLAADQLQDGGEITYAMEKNIENWNINSSAGNTLDTAMAIRTLLPYTFVANPDLSVSMNEDVLESAEMVSEDPQTIEYKIKEEAVWNDGTPISAEDFIYVYKTMNGRDCPDCEAASNAGYRDMESVTGSDNGKTVTVVYTQPYTDWQEKFSSGEPLYPAHIAKEQGDLNTPAGLKKAFDHFAETVPTYSGSQFKVKNWENKVALQLVPNENFWGEKPKLNQVNFRVIEDANQEPTALANNEVQVINPQPQVDLVNQVRDIPNVSAQIGFGLGWELLQFNMETPVLGEKPLREALYTAFNREDLVKKTVGQFAPETPVLNNRNFMPQHEATSDNVTHTQQGSGNVDAAKDILTEAGYTIEGGQLKDPNGDNVPELRMIYTTGNQIRQNTCELFAQTAKELGVNVKIVPTDDLGGVLSEAKFDIALYAWIAAPYPYSGAIQLWDSESESNYGHYKNEQVDTLLAEAASETDKEVAAQKVNEADKLMTDDAYVLPLYQKPTFLAAYDNIANIRNNSTLDTPTYNIAQWGLRPE